ncbi:hypothetical protein DFH09DRAFT_1171827 [Mycena vulgaris]|nr:hypothetical protein DFH09DRAFT_1171827 [Mycena vulgaris]
MISLRAWAPRGIWRPIPLRNRCSSIRHCSVEASPDSAPRKERAVRKLHTVLTLNPSLITPTDYLDISQRKSITIRFALAHPSGRSMLRYYSGVQSTEHARSTQPKRFTRIPFPAHTQGFLYYSSATYASPLEGGLRFRCTTGNSPSSFHRGHDLLATPGFPWHISLPQLACRTGYAWITKQLVYENLVTQKQLAQCQSVFGHHRPTWPHLTLFRLDSTFLLDFWKPLFLTIVGTTLHRLLISALCTDEAGGVAVFPWTGSAVALFEPSSLPEHAGRRVLHIRIAKIIQPVVCTVEGYKGRVVRPEEGHLFTVRLHGGPPEPWAYDIDHKKTEAASALRVLWDNSQGP